MKSPITYYGGKTSMLVHILPLIPKHEVYTETFFGGGTVFFAKAPVKNETINDRLNLVVNFYRQLKTNFAELKKMIDETLFSKTMHQRALIMVRNAHCFFPVELAWAFWFSCNFSYGNKIGGGIKYSNDQSILPPQVLRNNKRNFTDQLVERLEKTHIENRDGVEVLKSRNVAKAFHFIDTPYFNADQGHYKGYTAEDLKKVLEFCVTCKGKFLLCNYNSDLLDEYVTANGWQKEIFTFNNKGMRKNEVKKREVMVYNYAKPNKNLFEFKAEIDEEKIEKEEEVEA